MNYNELLQLYFERSTALQSYWNLYVIVVGGLLAFASLRKDPDLVTTTLISVLFLCFAYKNLGAIEEVTGQRHAVLASMKQISASESRTEGMTALEATLHPPAFEGVRNFHWTSDLLTLAALWAMERRRRSLKKA